MFGKPQLLFLRAVLQKKIQQIAYIIFSLDCLHEAGVWIFLRRFWGIVGFPFSEQMIVVGQDTKGMVPVLPEFLPLASLPDIAPPGRGLTVISKAKILGQLLGGLPGGEVIEPGGKVDHVAVCAAAETVETGVHLHAGVAVIVEGAAGHTAAPHRNAVHFRRLPDGNGLFYDFKDALAHTHLPPALGTGGLYPAALARSLAAFRRSAL